MRRFADRFREMDLWGRIQPNLESGIGAGNLADVGTDGAWALSCWVSGRITSGVPAQPKEANDVAGSRIAPVSHANTVHIASRFNTLAKDYQLQCPKSNSRPPIAHTEHRTDLFNVVADDTAFLSLWYASARYHNPIRQDWLTDPIPKDPS